MTIDTETKAASIDAYKKDPGALYTELRTTPGGLSAAEARRRLASYGQNALPEGKRVTMLGTFLRQFRSPLIGILLISAVIVFLRGETLDGAIILFVLMFNAVIGTFQEGRAQDTLAALRRFARSEATTLRDGREVILGDEVLVPGDIILLQEGDKVPADARIVSSNNLCVEQSALTGESVPVHKSSDRLDGDRLVFADQINMVFRGSLVTSGSGTALIVATGAETVMGSLSKSITSIKSEIPLERAVKSLSQWVAIGVLGIIAIVFIYGVSAGYGVDEMFSVAVSLAVSVVPEGLPIVLTLVLATGMWKMTRHRVLVKQLSAVEALGQIDVLAVDKTGTITENKLAVEAAYCGGRTYEVGGAGYEPEGEIRIDGGAIDPKNHDDLLMLGRVAALSGGARLIYDEENREWRVSGDPTEAALVVFARKVGFRKDVLEREMQPLSESPFDYATKIHRTVHRTEKGLFIAVTGAPEEIIRRSTTYRRGTDHLPLNREKWQEIEREFLKLSRKGLRVVGAAYREVRGEHGDADDDRLVFVGFFGMKDSLRPGVTEAADIVRAAGVRLVMITGDVRETAEVIAREAGILHSGEDVLSGADIDRMSDEEVVSRLERVAVYARVTPDHKLRIVRAYQLAGRTIAMTGDGVNDAPSLVAADVGVAMGRNGTEVAKEAADLVLLDDRFENVIRAMEEGRSIYRKVRQVVTFLFSTNVAELMTILGSIVLGLPLPLLATQIIWLNLVADGFLDVSLGMEPKERHLLGRSSRYFTKSLIDQTALIRIFVMAIPMTVGTLYLFSRALECDGIEKAWTMALTTLVVFHWFNVWNCRREETSVFRVPLFSNRYLLGALAIIVTLQLFAVYHPLMQRALHTMPLSLREWGVIIAVASSIIVAEEIRKFAYRWVGARPRVTA